MYRLVLLDDEEIVIRGIQKVFHMEDYGFEVVKTFQNPVQALERIKELNPHLIITDIKMPQMDGLQFSEKVKEILPDTEIVILSGYDDFSYARTAMKIGVSDYLLKPIKKSDFSDMLKKMHTRIEEKVNQASYYENLQQFADENIHELKNHLLLKMTEAGDVVDSEYDTMLQKLKEDYEGYSFVLVKMLVEEVSSSKDYMLQMGQMVANLEGRLESFGTLESFQSDEKLYIIIFGKEIIRSIHDIEQTIHSYVQTKKQDGAVLFAGMSGIHHELTSLFRAGNECDEQILVSRGQILKGSQRTQSEMFDFDTNIPYKEMEQLFLAISTNDAEQMRDAIETIYRFPENVVYRDFSYSLTFMILVKLRQLMNRYDISNNMISGDLLDLGMLRREYPGVAKQKELIGNIAFVLADRMSDQSTAAPSKIVLSAVSYIQKHFNENISLSDVAEQTNISKNYLSDLFRKELNTTFINYVTQLRVDKAKYYLTQTDMKMYEISAAVGYNDYAYFSTLFKKNTGATLSEYRKQN